MYKKDVKLESARMGNSILKVMPFIRDYKWVPTDISKHDIRDYPGQSLQGTKVHNRWDIFSMNLTDPSPMGVTVPNIKSFNQMFINRRKFYSYCNFIIATQSLPVRLCDMVCYIIWPQAHTNRQTWVRFQSYIKMFNMLCVCVCVCVCALPVGV